jgi:hypothetical protein
MATTTRKSSSGSTPRKPAARKSAPRKRSTPPKSASKRSSGTGTLVAGAAVGIFAAGAFGLLELFRRGALDPLLGRNTAEHVPTDLMTDEHPDGSERAPVDFRPDPTAPIPAGERDAFRPALAGASAPTMVRGTAPELDRLDASPS